MRLPSLLPSDWDAPVFSYPQLSAQGGISLAPKAAIAVSGLLEGGIPLEKARETPRETSSVINTKEKNQAPDTSKTSCRVPMRKYVKYIACTLNAGGGDFPESPKGNHSHGSDVESGIALLGYYKGLLRVVQKVCSG